MSCVNGNQNQVKEEKSIKNLDANLKEEKKVLNLNEEINLDEFDTKKKNFEENKLNENNLNENQQLIDEQLNDKKNKKSKHERFNKKKLNSNLKKIEKMGEQTNSNDLLNSPTDENGSTSSSELNLINSLKKQTYLTRRDKLITIFLLFFNCILYLISKLVALFHKPKRHEIPPIDDRLLLLSASEITNQIKNNQLKCEQIVKAYINRIEIVQKKINAVIDNAFESAILQAKQIDDNLKDYEKANELKKLPLLGVPFTCKNSIAIQNLAFDSGSFYRKGIKADEDALVIKNLRIAGAIPLAITNVPELVLWCDSENKVYGRTSNPYDLSRGTGGSSGGEAALITCAGSVFGVGSDVAGSIRIPSMFNGVFGHKPTPSYVPITGMFPKSPSSFDDFVSFGPLCRYASDLPLLLNAMSGGITEKLELNKPVDFSKIKIYYMESDGGNPLTTLVDQRIKDKMHKAVNYFSSKYNTQAEKIVINKFKFGLSFFGAHYGESDVDFLEIVTCGHGRINLLLELIKYIFGLSHFTLPILIHCINQYIPICRKNTAIHKKIIKILQNLKPQIHELLGDNAVLFYPTWPTLAPKHQTTVLRGFDANYTAIFNALSVPATHVPMGLTQEEGLPIGFTIAAGPHQDRLNVAFAKEIEKEFGGWICPS